MNVLLHDQHGTQICEINLGHKIATRQRVIILKRDSYSTPIHLSLDKAYEFADLIVAIKEETERRETA